MTNNNLKREDSFSFHKLRNIIWPIEVSELKKFLPMAFIMFCVIFNYSALRGIKDTLIVTSIGAEAIPFVKSMLVMPSAIIFTVIYMRLINKFGDLKIFYIISSVFIAYFALFILVLYPSEQFFHPDPENIKKWSILFPRFKWFIMIYGKWIYSTMYIFAELWGSVMLSLLFWQFANKITSTTEAKRFYPMFGLIGNFGLLISGSVMKNLAKTQQDQVIIKMTIMVVILGLVCVGLYYFINRYILTDIRYYNPNQEGKPKKQKTKLSVGESIKMIFSSKYLGLLTILVLAYGISINLVEVSWKSKARELYPTQAEYLQFTGLFNQLMAVGVLFFMILGSNILRLMSWKTAASITPIVIFFTGLGFFTFSYFQKELDSFSLGFFGVSSLVVAVILGGLQNILSKSIKYSLFDSTKEMAYIPIDDELKTKGKAAVDVIGGRMGKAGGAAIQSVLLLIFTSGLESLTPYTMGIFIVIVVAWLYAVGALSSEYNTACAKKKNLDNE